MDPLTLPTVIGTLNDWAGRPWDLALLIALDKGPTTSIAAYDAAVGWAAGQLPDGDLPRTMAELVTAGLAVHLGGRGDAALFAMTSAGSQLLDRFEQATRDLRLLRQLVDFADRCVLHGLLLQLTPSESRILGLVVHGRTDQYIADALFVSRRTVETQVQRILRKLGIRSRDALIARLTIEQVEF